MHRPVPFRGHIELLARARDLGLNPSNILDVGANSGRWTRAAIRIFPDAKYLLIEPQVEMRPHLNALCRRHANVRWSELAAGPVTTESQLTIFEGLAGSSLLPTCAEAKAWQKVQRPVPVRPIDTLVAGAIPDIAKLDIQGYELQALEGARTLFGTTELFIVEASLFRFMTGMPLIRDLVSFFGERGYEPYDFLEPLRRPLDGALGQIDVAFAKARGSLRWSDGW